MMPHLADIYNDAFFQEWGVEHEKYIRSAEILTDLIYAWIQPTSLIDIGCGCGVYSHFFRQKNVRVLSLDGVIPPPQYAYPIPVEQQDLTVPFPNKWGLFDMALCLEVAEHIPETYLDVFLRNITQLSDTLILSAAPPGQGGHHHVNEQPKRYWVQHLIRHGFAYDRKKTGTFIETFKNNKAPYMWMGEHISFYGRVKNPAQHKADLPFSHRFLRS